MGQSCCPGTKAIICVWTGVETRYVGADPQSSLAVWGSVVKNAATHTWVHLSFNPPHTHITLTTLCRTCSAFTWQQPFLGGGVGGATICVAANWGQVSQFLSCHHYAVTLSPLVASPAISHPDNIKWCLLFLLQLKVFERSIVLLSVLTLLSRRVYMRLIKQMVTWRKTDWGLFSNFTKLQLCKL